MVKGSIQEDFTFLNIYAPNTRVCLVTSVVSNSLRPYGPWPARLLCPWGSPGKNTGVGCHFLLHAHRRAAKYIKQISTDIKGEINGNTIGDLNTPYTSMNRSSRQKIKKATEIKNDIIEELDLIDIF